MYYGVFRKVIVTRRSAVVVEHEEFTPNNVFEAFCQTILQIIVFNNWITLDIPKTTMLGMIPSGASYICYHGLRDETV